MKRIRRLCACLLALSLAVSLSACGAPDSLSRLETAIQDQRALDGYTFDGNLAFTSYDENGQIAGLYSVMILGSCKREETGWLYLWNVSHHDVDTGKTTQTIMRRQYPEETFPREADIVGWLPSSLSLREDVLDGRFSDSVSGTEYCATVKGDRIANDYATALCEEEGLVLGEANLTYQMEGSRLASEQVKYEFYDKNQAPGQNDVPAKEVFLRITYDQPSDESKIEIPEMSSDVTYLLH